MTYFINDTLKLLDFESIQTPFSHKLMISDSSLKLILDKDKKILSGE